MKALTIPAARRRTQTAQQNPSITSKMAGRLCTALTIAAGVTAAVCIILAADEAVTATTQWRAAMGAAAVIGTLSVMTSTVINSETKGGATRAIDQS